VGLNQIVADFAAETYSKPARPKYREGAHLSIEASGSGRVSLDISNHRAEN
jgi:hypothetical protein